MHLDVMINDMQVEYLKQIVYILISPYYNMETDECYI
jgi:hypothetical protein